VAGSEREKRYTGEVIRKPFATGSKSERQAVMLSTRYGVFVLRRLDAHTLVDPELDKLVGKRIRVRGVVHRHTLTILEWEEV
jgi:hypothetical protein